MLSHRLRRAVSSVPVVGVLLLIVVACRGCAAPPQRGLTLATTTSVANSGLLDALLPAFEQSHGLKVRVHQAGSGRALGMLEKGQADIVISHAPQAERAALRTHPRWRYTKLMFNEFAIVGPAADPARVAQAATAVDAMRRIAQAGGTFISRGDESGTHERERQLWDTAAIRPAQDRLVVAGSGMGGTLRVAAQMDAYTLTDTATFEQVGSSTRLVRLFAGDVLLLNTYAVVTPDDLVDADRFAEWLLRGDGRRLIAAFAPNGRTPAFHVWPQGRPASDPAAMPQ